ncbi:hypothetical protein [uncultured Dubosiella sp.]|nr:hypothetical protein [uncultured Dubosiella sp.]
MKLLSTTNQIDVEKSEKAYKYYASNIGFDYEEKSQTKNILNDRQRI